MNYQHIYNQLIAKAQARSNIKGYVEKHHIVPKSLGGTDFLDNLVTLTAKEHFVAHALLAKMHGGNMWHALMRMKGFKQRYINARIYEIARREHGKEITKVMLGPKNPMRQPTIRAKHRAIVAAAMQRPEVKQRQRDSRLGVPLSDFHKQTLSDSHMGIKLSALHCEGIRKAQILANSRPEVRAKKSAGMKLYWAKRKEAQNVNLA